MAAISNAVNGKMEQLTAWNRSSRLPDAIPLKDLVLDAELGSLNRMNTALSLSKY